MKPVLRPSEDQATQTAMGVDYGRVFEHPLNRNEGSLWGRYFVDQAIWVEIEKDIKRTRSDLDFFTDPVDPTKRKFKE